MTQPMKLQNDLFRPTSSSESVILNESITRASTESVAAIYVFNDFVEVKKPKNGFVSMDDFLVDLESDSDFSESLPAGRKWVADSFYKDKNSLSKLRLEKGWSQKQLAEKLNTKQPYIARIENGIEDIQLSTIKKLAKIFGLSILEILEAIS
jgi:DNA-binding XRE family transcriptional regulator